MVVHDTVGTTVPTTAQVMLRSAWYGRRSDALRRLWHRTHAGHRARRV